jgi:hypothetical protein
MRRILLKPVSSHTSRSTAVALHASEVGGGGGGDNGSGGGGPLVLPTPPPPPDPTAFNTHTFFQRWDVDNSQRLFNVAENFANTQPFNGDFPFADPSTLTPGFVQAAILGANTFFAGRLLPSLMGDVQAFMNNSFSGSIPTTPDGLIERQTGFDSNANERWIADETVNEHSGSQIEGSHGYIYLADGSGQHNFSVSEHFSGNSLNGDAVHQDSARGNMELIAGQFNLFDVARSLWDSENAVFGGFGSFDDAVKNGAPLNNQHIEQGFDLAQASYSSADGHFQIGIAEWRAPAIGLVMDQVFFSLFN